MHLYEHEDPEYEVEYSYVLQKFDKCKVTGECKWWSCYGNSIKDVVIRKYVESQNAKPCAPYRVIKVTKEIKRDWEVLDIDLENVKSE